MILSIESAGPLGGVALLEPDGSGHELISPLGPGRGQILPELVSLVLRVAGVSVADLSLIAVDVGPGSFTGLRVGLSLTKALAQVMRTPMVGVRQTEALSAPLVEVWPGPVCVWIHDRREFVYMAWTSRDHVGKENVLSWEEGAERLRRKGAVLLAGDGAIRFREELRSRVPEVVLAGEEWAHPRPLVVAKLGRARYTQKGSQDPVSLEPYYVHKED